MLERSFQNNYNLSDFSFVYNLNEDDLNLFFDVTDFAIESMVEVINESREYTNSLSSDQLKEVVDYFYKILDVYTDYELYEECNDIVFVINTCEDRLKNLDEKVGNMN